MVQFSYNNKNINDNLTLPFRSRYWSIIYLWIINYNCTLHLLVNKVASVDYVGGNCIRNQTVAESWIMGLTSEISFLCKMKLPSSEEEKKRKIKNYFNRFIINCFFIVVDGRLNWSIVHFLIKAKKVVHIKYAYMHVFTCPRIGRHSDSFMVSI